VGALEALLGLAQVLGGNQQNQQQQAAQNAQLKQMKDAFKLEKDKYGWTKEQADKEWNFRLQQAGINQQSADNYWDDVTPGETREETLATANNLLSPMYADQMQKTLDNTNQGLLARGFFGQAPGAELTNKNVAEVEKAKNEAVSSLGNDLYQQSQNRALQEKQFGIGAFGQYGDVDPIVDPTPVTPAANPTNTRQNPNVQSILSGQMKKMGGTPIQPNNQFGGLMSEMEKRLRK
jgi:hypothetical protein